MAVLLSARSERGKLMFEPTAEEIQSAERQYLAAGLCSIILSRIATVRNFTAHRSVLTDEDVRSLKAVAYMANAIDEIIRSQATEDEILAGHLTDPRQRWARLLMRDEDLIEPRQQRWVGGVKPHGSKDVWIDDRLGDDSLTHLEEEHEQVDSFLEMLSTIDLPLGWVFMVKQDSDQSGRGHAVDGWRNPLTDRRSDSGSHLP